MPRWESNPSPRREREKRQRLSRSEREEKTVPVPEGQGPWRGTRNFRFGSSRPYRFTFVLERPARGGCATGIAR
jgi:hypothetical protein